MSEQIVTLKLNQQQIELMDRTLAKGVAPDRASLVRLALREYAAKSEQNMRDAQPVLSPMMTNFKFAAGKLIGLRDDRMVGKKTVFEGKIKRAVERDPKLGEAAAKVWDEMATAYKTWTPSEKMFEMLESDAAPGSQLFRIARQIVRMSDEKAKPDDQRLTEYKSYMLPALVLISPPAPATMPP